MNEILKYENTLSNDVYNVRDAFLEKDYSFSVDWLNVRLDCGSLDVLKQRLKKYLPELDVTAFVTRDSGGVCFYEKGEYLSTLGYSSFVISYNVDFSGQIITTGSKRGDLYGIFLSISGDGCRYIEHLHKNAFCDFITAISIFSPHCSRIDIACDIFDKENMLIPLMQDFADTAYDPNNARVDFICGLNRIDPKTKEFRQWVTLDLVYDNKIKSYTRNITIGGRSCKKGTLQLYNKRAEITSGRLDSDIAQAVLNSVGNPDYWWRLEVRCKSYAQIVFDCLLNSRCIYSTFLEAINRFGKFVSSTCSNIYRADDCIVWTSFLYFVNQLSKKYIHLVQLVNTPYVPISLDRIEKYQVDSIAANTFIHMMRMCLDKKYFYQCMPKHMYSALLNPRYRPAFDELRVLYGPKLYDFIDDLIWNQSSFDCE